MHTSRYSACSIATPQRICELAVQRGLDAVVFTEHQLQWLKPELSQLRGANPELRIYSGVEVSLAEGYDVVVICENQSLHFPFAIKFKELLEELSYLRSPYFTFVAHPFRYHSARPSELEMILSQVDGIELNSVNILRGQAHKKKDKFLPLNTRAYLQAQEEYGLIPLFNSDAHADYSVGAIANFVDWSALPKDELQLAKLLKKGQLEEYQNPELLKKALGPSLVY
jgi:histidinol phosphatase-like PHP family hydrolase